MIQLKLSSIQEKTLPTNDQHNKTLEMLKQQLLKEQLSHTPTQSFHILMGLIRITEKMKKAKIIHVGE